MTMDEKDNVRMAMGNAMGENGYEREWLWARMAKSGNGYGREWQCVRMSMGGNGSGRQWQEKMLHVFVLIRKS
ncbi:hypothetical protein CEXT_152141 [Caerostris extrusa]|uniref:Uncharacterized protein n=1 Tax=Caerostris extrusa TaxID=172846 RepID=A0AAV4VI47_CAEEX|nr:hypothetical protein CEXT_152141 [Caerostris extrusa]